MASRKSILKILFISDPDSPYTRRWLNWFDKKGHSVFLAADKPMTIEWPNVKVSRLADKFNYSIAKYLVWIFYLRLLIREINPDIVHAHRVSSAGWLAAFLNFHPLVVTPWGSDLYLHPERSLVANWLAKLVLRRADLITANSRDLCNQAIRFGANPTYTHVIQWGVDINIFKPGEKPLDLLEEHKIHTGPIILSPRAVKPIYNLDVIVKTIPIIREFFPEVIYVFRNYNTDPNYKLQIENLIKKLDVNASVRWIGRVDPWQKNAAVYRLADLAISIASSDATPGSILESFACGIPVIASDLPSIREWIENDKNGILISPRDYIELSRAILNLLQNPSRMVSFKEKNISLVHLDANQENEMKKIENLYQELINRT